MIKFKNLPDSDKPRERLYMYGSENLSNEELISIILKTGTKNLSVKEVSLKLLESVGDIAKIKDIETVIADWETAQATYVDSVAMYASTYHLNENVSTFINQLEEKIPTGVVITGFSSNNAGVTLPAKASNYEDVAEFIVQLKTIDCVDDVFIGSLVKEVGEDGETTFSFAVTAVYVVPVDDAADEAATEAE